MLNLRRRRSMDQGENWSFGIELPSFHYLRPLHGERTPENTGQTQQRVAPTDAADVMGAVADDLAVGTEHGVLQTDRVEFHIFNRIHGYGLLWWITFHSDAEISLGDVFTL
jgi:hypothetical protein